MLCDHKSSFIYFVNVYLRSPFRLKLVTWNVGDEEPLADFTDLLDLKTDPLPDIYGIGLVVGIIWNQSYTCACIDNITCNKMLDKMRNNF